MVGSKCAGLQNTSNR